MPSASITRETAATSASFSSRRPTLIRTSEDPHHKAPDWMGIPAGTDLSGRVRPPLEKFGVGEDGNLGQVLSQDAELLPEVQRGVRSRGFKGQLWGEQEQRLRHFHAELERYLADDRAAGARSA